MCRTMCRMSYEVYSLNFEYVWNSMRNTMSIAQCPICNAHCNSQSSCCGNKWPYAAFKVNDQLHIDSDHVDK